MYIWCMQRCQAIPGLPAYCYIRTPSMMIAPKSLQRKLKCQIKTLNDVGSENGKQRLHLCNVESGAICRICRSSHGFMGGQSGTVVAGQINLQVVGAELPCDTCVQVDMHSTGRGGCACRTLTLIPGTVGIFLFMIPGMVYPAWDYAMLFMPCFGYGAI